MSRPVDPFTDVMMRLAANIDQREPDDPSVVRDRNTVLARLCHLLARVRNLPAFDGAADCVCVDRIVDPYGGYQCDERILAFIEEAVSLAIAKHKETAK